MMPGCMAEDYKILKLIQKSSTLTSQILVLSLYRYQIFNSQEDWCMMKYCSTLKYAVQLVQNNNKKDDESERCCAMQVVTYS